MKIDFLNWRSECIQETQEEKEVADFEKDLKWK